MTKEERNRYLLYNNEGKILVLFAINTHFAKIYLPGSFSHLTGSLEFQKEIEKIKDNLIDIYTLNDTYNRLQAVNRKLKPVAIEVLKKFYSCYVDDKEFFNEIYNYFRKYGFQCELLTIDEIMAINECSIIVDSGMKEATKILSKKLTYEIY